MKTTIVIPCHNHGRYLRQAVMSCFQGKIQPDNVIIINDHSSDMTHIVGQQLEKEYNRVSYVNSKQCGVVAARNQAINMIDEGLVIPLDADDYFTVNGVNALVSHWQPGTFTYGGWIDFTSFSEQKKNAPEPSMLTTKNICHATICFDINDYHKVNGYDSDFEIGCEDWAFTLALKQAGIEPIKIYDTIYYKRNLSTGRASVMKAWHKDIQDLMMDKFNVYVI